MPFVDTNRHWMTKPCNFDIKCECTFESHKQHRFLGALLASLQAKLHLDTAVYRKLQSSQSAICKCIFPHVTSAQSITEAKSSSEFVHFKHENPLTAEQSRVVRRLHWIVHFHRHHIDLTTCKVLLTNPGIFSAWH